MFANAKLLTNLTAAATALLAGSTSIHTHHNNTGAFSLMLQGCQKASPGDIGNRAAQPAVPQHPLDVQAFYRDEAVATAQFEGSLVSVVMPEIPDAFMDSLQLMDSLTSIRSSLLLATYGTARPTEGWQFVFEVFWVRLMVSIGGRVEAFNTYVDSYKRIFARLNLNLSEVTREDDIPLVVLQFKSDRLDLTFNRSVLFDLQLANMLNAEFSVFEKFDAVAVVGKGYGGKPALGLEARITWLFLGLYTAKERLEGTVESSHCAISTVSINVGKPLVGTPLICVPGRLLKKSNGNAVFGIRELSLFQTGVVEPAVSLQHDLKLALLVGVGVKPKFERFVHLSAFYHPKYTPVGKTSQGEKDA